MQPTTPQEWLTFFKADQLLTADETIHLTGIQFSLDTDSKNQEDKDDSDTEVEKLHITITYGKLKTDKESYEVRKTVQRKKGRPWFVTFEYTTKHIPYPKKASLFAGPIARFDDSK